LRVPHPLTALSIVLALAVAGCGSGNSEIDVDPPDAAPATEAGDAASFALERVASGFNRPTWAGAAPGDPRALWVLEQPGRVVRVAGGRREVVLDLSDRVLLGGEQGLLGIAFHPDFATDGRIYLHWSGLEGETRVAELERRADGTFDPEPRRELLTLDQPEENHNGGQLAFGPDGRLYLGLGDGGGAFDADQRAQDLDDLHGKIVSADLREAEPRWRVDLYGLRNPWRFSFDPALGELWIADVGQDEIEEINRVLPEPDEPPKNLGWSLFEGVAELDEGHERNATGELVWPVATYTHDDGCSVTGGLVYRGSDLPELAGRYLYGDFCSGILWSLKPTAGGGAQDVRRERATVPQLTHIGLDGMNRIVLAAADGTIHRARRP
jgi:glucose/arabinose dehydrogenase